MILAEVPLGLDTLAGGGVTGMLVAVMYAFLRRTRDTDERRDDASRAREEAAKLIMAEALRRESFAWTERDRALKALEDLRVEMERRSLQYETERERWMKESRHWKRDTGETEAIETTIVSLPRSDQE